MINSLLDETGVVGFEASDDALVFWLDMCSKVWLEVFNLNVLEAIGNNMARKVILKEQYLPFFFLELVIPLLNPVLIDLGSHPSLHIISVVKPQLSTSLPLESSWPCCFPNDKRWEFLRSIGIQCEGISQPDLLALNS